MVSLKVENAWVEFPVKVNAHAHARSGTTGGQLDAARGVVTALQDISFELKEGDRLGLMGHNGAGKTTMLRLLAGAYPPTRGRTVTVGQISTLFSSTPGLSMDGTGRENLLNCGLYLGMSRRKIRDKMDEMIDFAGLGDFIDLPVRTYSAGMVTRLGFSIATAVEPEILLLDEGLATGDAQFAQKAQAKMDELIKRSSILVIASHSETLLERMCNCCLLLEHGQVVAEGAPGQLAQTYRSAVVAAAQADEQDALYRAYVLATDMAKRGTHPPLELEEQGLRYALRIAPDDLSMKQRYVAVLKAQKKPVPASVETELLVAALDDDPARTDLVERLSVLLGDDGESLTDNLRKQAKKHASAQKAG